MGERLDPCCCIDHLGDPAYLQIGSCDWLGIWEHGICLGLEVLYEEVGEPVEFAQVAIEKRVSMTRLDISYRRKEKTKA